MVLGASVNPERYANRAIKSLRQHGHPVYAVGIKEGTVDDVMIKTGIPEFKDVDTVTLYLSVKNQKQYYDYIFSLKPKRIIFNPGTENPEFETKTKESGAEAIEGCTLVMLRTGQF